MIRPRTTAIRRNGLPLDEDDLMDQALQAELGVVGGTANRDETLPITEMPDLGSYGEPGGARGPANPNTDGGLGGAVRTVQTGPNSTMPVTDPSAPRGPSSSPGSASGAAGPAGTGTRRVPLSGRENQANLWGIHNSEVWDNPDSPDLNRRALRVLMRYPPTTEGTQQAMQDPDWLADPDLAAATYDGRDRINFHGALSAGDEGVPVNEVDVMASWQDGTSQGYRWGDVDNDYGGDTGGGGGGGGGPTGDLTGDVQGGAIDMPEMNDTGGLDVPEIDPGNIDEILRMIRQLMDPRQQDALLGGALEEEFR